jgi:hypothetical protein
MMVNNELEGMWKEEVVAPSVGSPPDLLSWYLQAFRSEILSLKPNDYVI